MEGLTTEFDAPRITIVVPTRDALVLVQRLVDSLARCVSIPVRLVFVDTGSTDGTRDYLHALARVNARQVVVLCGDGSPHAEINRALSRAEGHVLFLAPDVQTLRPGSVETLLQALEGNPSAGAVGPTNDIGPGPQSIEKNLAFPEVHRVRYLLGFCLLVRGEALQKAGDLDAELFPSSPYAFLDYSIRLREKGFELLCCRNAFVHQFGTEELMRDLSDPESEHRRRLEGKWGRSAVKALFAPSSFARARVLIAIPAYGAVPPEAYANHLTELAREIGRAHHCGLSLDVAVIKRSGIVAARNRVAHDAMRDGFTHVFFLDDDVLVPQGAVLRLLAHEKHIVSGFCLLRSPPHYPSMFIDPRRPGGKVAFIRSWPRDALIEVDAVGAACLLVRTDVFRKMREVLETEELFSFGKARSGEDVVSEDIYFAKRAKDAGFRIFVDTSVVFGHLGPPVVYDDKSVETAERRGGIDYLSYAQASRDARRSGERFGPEGGPPGTDAKEIPRRS